MGIFTSVIILILAMLIQAFFQLTPGVFALFYHYTLGKKSSKKAANLSLYFILGVAVFMSITWLIVYTLIFIFFRDKLDFCSDFCPWIMAGIFAAESLLGLFLYYRKGKTTVLFISRRHAANLSAHAQKVKTRSDAFILGLLANIPELIFTLPLYVISTFELMKITNSSRTFIIAAYIVFSILPLAIIRTAYQTDHNLADIERFRVRIKPFVRMIIFTGFLLLALLSINLGVLNYG